MKVPIENDIPSSVDSINYASISFTGPQRNENQDRILIKPELGFFAIADGMGGHADGALAAEIAVETAGEAFESSTAPYPMRVQQSVAKAVDELFLRNLNRREKMGTTLTVCHISNELVFSHIGDCRIYFYNGGFVEQLSQDHNLVSFLNEGQNKLTKSLGFDACVDAQVGSKETSKKFCVLLCTDGFYSEVDKEEIAQLLLQPSSDELEQIANKIDDQTPQDNYTAVLIWRQNDN